MRPPDIPLTAITTLPRVYRATIPDAYRDVMDHMNVRWYLALFDEAGIDLFEKVGITEAYFQAHQTGTMDLEHHIHYLAEVRIGDTVSIYARALGFTPKRFHYLLFMVNDSRQQLAATLEVMNIHVDMTKRRTAPYADFIAAQITALVEAHTRLGWQPPICGVMRP